MVATILGVEKYPEEHFGDVCGQSELKFAKSEENLEKVLETVGSLFNLGVETFAVVDCSAIPNDANWCCLFLLVDNAEVRKITRVLILNLVRFQRSDVVLLQISLEDFVDLGSLVV